MNTVLLNFRTIAIAAIAVTLGLAGSFGSLVSAAKANPHAAHMPKCATACYDCQLQCDACITHCALMVNEG